MRTTFAIACAAVLVASAGAFAQTVTITLESPQNGQSVTGGSQIAWTLKASVSGGDNVGLAAVSCDIVQDPNNPAFLDLPPADPNSLDATMLKFSRPAGISNPGEIYPTSGYTGVQRGTAGQKNLIQVGGAQNTFGQAGSSMGQNTVVTGGVGQGTPKIIAAGTFSAPVTNGTYTFRAANALANTLDSIGPSGQVSPVSAATVVTTGATFSFTIGGPAVCHGDVNCNGSVDFSDINPFVVALLNGVYCDGTGANADTSNNGSVGFEDINPFVILLTQNPLPIDCP